VPATNPATFEASDNSPHHGVPGQTYNVSFAMSGNPDANVPAGAKTMNVSAADTTSPYTYNTAVEQNTTTDMKWKDQTFSFAATLPAESLGYGPTPQAFVPC